MAEKLLRFVTLDPAPPEKRDADERARDHDEIYREFAAARAAEQASRCSQCGVPFCQVHCPLQNNIPDWLKLVAEDRLEEAYELSSATNTFPEICGRICPQDRLCEGNCVIEQSGHGAVTIGAVEKYITETAFAQGWVKPRLPVRERPETIGIIGAGPAGLAAAEMLRAKGYGVDIYDRHDRPGGLLVYGIPNFKLDKSVVERRVALLREAGVRFHCNAEIGPELPLDELRRRHAAVLIATGTYKARPFAAPGIGLPGIVPALAYLTASNRIGLGDSVADFDSGVLNAAGKRVVVVGGGDTAMDCVRTAIRQGAAEVTCLYRRDRAAMPGSVREVGHAEEEGVVFRWNSLPEAFLGSNAVSGVRTVRVAPSHGRMAPQPIAGTAETLPAELVILALGFEAEDVPVLFGAPELAVTGAGTLKVAPASFETSLPGVYAAGDIVRGASLVVWAISDGRRAADAIHQRVTAAALALREPADA